MRIVNGGSAMKFIEVLLMIVMLFSGLELAWNAHLRAISWNWDTATAEIEFIVQPEEIVVGTFTDKNGVTYHERELYIGNLENKKIGDKVKVLYGSKPTEHLNYTRMMSGLIISSVVLGGSVFAFVCILKRERKSKQKV